MVRCNASHKVYKDRCAGVLTDVLKPLLHPHTSLSPLPHTSPHTKHVSRPSPTPNENAVRGRRQLPLNSLKKKTHVFFTNGAGESGSAHRRLSAYPISQRKGAIQFSKTYLCVPRLQQREAPWTPHSPVTKSTQAVVLFLFPSFLSVTPRQPPSTVA